MKNENGFLMIQVIIAGTILSIMSLAVGRLISQQWKTTLYLEDKMERLELLRDIEIYVKDGGSCAQTLAGLTIPKIEKTANIASIKDSFGDVVYKSNTVKHALKVGQIKILNLSVVNPNSSGLVEIEVPISRTRDQSGQNGPQIFTPYKSKVSVVVDGSNKISTCSSVGEEIDPTTCYHKNGSSVKNNTNPHVKYNKQGGLRIQCAPDEFLHELVYAPGGKMDGNDISGVCCKRP